MANKPFNNPVFSRAFDIHVTEMLSGHEQRELVESLLPSLKDLMQDENSPAMKALLAHSARLEMDTEASVKQEYFQRGIKEIPLTELQVNKMKLFAHRLQDRNDKDVAKYFDLLRELYREISDDEIEPEDSEWDNIIEGIQSEVLINASRLQPEKLTGSAIKTLRSSGLYYFEELTSLPGSSVEYDPMYSLPPGVQPSEVLKIRMNKWQCAKAEESLICTCKPSTTSQATRGNVNLAVVVKKATPCFILFEHLFIVNGIPQPSSPLPCISNADPNSLQAVGKIFKSIDAFINKLFSFTSQEVSQDIIETSLSLIQELIDSSLFKIAVPLLVTLLHGTVTLTKSSLSTAYQFLVESLTRIGQREDIPAFERWFFKAACEYISGMQGKLMELSTTLQNFISYLFTQKSKDLVSEVTNAVCSKRERSLNLMLEPMINHCIHQIGLRPPQCSTRSAIYYLKGLLRLNDKDKSSVINGIIQAVWLNSEFMDSAAKVFAYVLPHDHLSMLNNTTTLVIPPEQCNLEIYRREKEIESKISSKSMSHYDAAMWYLDLMVTEPSIRFADEKVLCLLKAAQHLAYQFSQVPNSQPQHHALKNAVLMLAYDASQLATTRLHPGLRIFALKTAYQLTCFVSHMSDPSYHSCLSGRVAIGLLRNLHHSVKFTFLVSQPMTSDNFWVAAAPYIGKVSTSAYVAYIEKLLQIPSEILPIKQSLLHYQRMEMCYRSDHVQEPHFQEKRIITMTAFLNETKWKFEDVTKAMSTDLFKRTEEGFIKREEHLCKYLEIAELKGIVFNDDERNPSIHVIIKPAESGNGILSYKDIIEVLQLTVNEVSTISFSLDPPSGTEKYHPFMTLRCHPRKLQDTEFMKSLFHADYLLKFFSTGVEVSAKYPYKFKPVKESLLKDLPDTLHFLHYPPYALGQSHMSSHRFWIEIEEVTYDEHKSKNKAIYYIGEVKVKVRSRPMVVTLNGNTMDAKHSEEGPHAQFAHKLTNNYKELSKSFPIFARVKELSKIQFLAQMHHAHLKHLETESPKLFESASKEMQRLHQLHPLESNPHSCLWVPATFNNYVYGGVLSNFKSSHLDYLSRPGEDHAPCALDAVSAGIADGYDSLVAPVKAGVGGVKIQLHRLLKSHSSQEELESEYMCVKLGDDLKASPIAQVHSEQDLVGVVHQPHMHSDVETTDNAGSPENFKGRKSEQNDVHLMQKPVSSPTDPTSSDKLVQETPSDVQVHDDKKVSNTKEKHVEANNSVHELAAMKSQPSSANKAQTEPTCERKLKVVTDSKTDHKVTQDEENQPKINLEFDIDSVMSRTADNQISFVTRGAQVDSLLSEFSKSLLNKAIFGESLNDSQLKGMLQSVYNFNEIRFHPHLLACHLIKTAIVLRKIVEYHYKRGTERQVI